MSAPLGLWVDGRTYGAGRHGGWAFVEAGAGEVRGRAGGGHGAGARRMALTAILEALRTAAPTLPATVHVPPAVLAGARNLAAWREDDSRSATNEPIDDRDLWEKVMLAMRARPGSSFAALAPAQATFVAAWADFALERVKSKGPFTAAIPKPNLTRFPA